MRTPDFSSVEYSVLISGIASMGLEMVAGRMLAPVYGSSVYTWGSVIGVFMAALALGYYYGGRKAVEADRKSISDLFLAASVYAVLLTFFGQQLVGSFELLPVGNRYLPLFPSTVLFGPPAFLLGFVSPYAAQLSRSTVKGEASGRVYALGTAGSIIGTFAATFVLIPYLSVTQVLASMTVVTVIGVVVTASGTQHFYSYTGYALVLISVLSFFLLFQSSLTGAVYSTQTPYQSLEVRDSGGVRTLYLNEQPQSAVYLNGSRAYPWDYPRYFHIPLLMRDEPDIDRVLFIGAGGFSGPRRFAEEYDASIDVVEIDPEVVSVGERYFNSSEISGMDVYVEDGRRFLRETNRTYELIVLDAYRKSSVPFHLTTKEFMELASRRMDEDGVFYANLISAPSGPRSIFYRSEYRTAEEVFPQVYGFRTSRSPLTQNVQLIATKDSWRVSEEILIERNRERDIGLNLSAEVRDMLPEPDLSGVPVLRDERAPVSRLTDPLLGTEYVIEGRAESKN